MSAPSTTRDKDTCDVVIVGGGIIGLSSALALAEAGANVLVLDGAPGPATAASGAAAGIISLLYPWECADSLQALAADSSERYADWCRELTAVSGIDTGWQRWGLVSFDCDDEPAARRWAATTATTMETIPASAVPGLNPPHSSAWWFPTVGAVEPAQLLEALQAAAVARGVRCRWDSPVTALHETGGVVRGVHTPAGVVHADATVVASGAWSAKLVPGIPVQPVRGQILELEGPVGALDRIIVSGHRYVLPRADGRIVVGSTVEQVGFDAAPTDAGARGLREFASGLLPASADWPQRRHWAGLRPGSADGLPMIGPVTDRPGLWLNTGHFRNGITLAPGSAVRLAALMAD